MGMLFCIRDWETSQGRQKDGLKKKNRAILSNNLFQSALDFRLGRWFTFHHDNDPKHTAKKTQDWLWENPVKVLE